MYIYRDSEGIISGAFTMCQSIGQEWLDIGHPELDSWLNRDSPDLTAVYKSAVQAHLDAAAAIKGYGDERTAPIVSACSYAGHPNAFQSEGIAFLQWRSAVWMHCYAVLSDVQNAIRTAPTVPELIAELPALVLP